MIINIFIIAALIGFSYIAFFKYCCGYRHKINNKIRKTQDAEQERNLIIYRDNKSKRCKFAYHDWEDAVIAVPLFFSILFLLVVTIMLMFFITINGTAEASKQGLLQEQAILQYEVNTYSDLGDVVSKKKTLDDVREFNKKLAKNKVYEKNFWVGCFYADIYSDIDFIKIE